MKEICHSFNIFGITGHNFLPTMESMNTQKMRQKQSMAVIEVSIERLTEYKKRLRTQWLELS